MESGSRSCQLRYAIYLIEHDLRGGADKHVEHDRLVAQERRTRLIRAGPLIATADQIGEDQHTLLITMHHIVSDVVSMGVLFNELSALYGAYFRGGERSLPKLEVPIRRLCGWQRMD